MKLHHLICTIVLLLLLSVSLSRAEELTKPCKITFNSDGVTLIDGVKVFPITFTIIPKPDAKAHNDKSAFEEWADAGVLFMRTGRGEWNDETMAEEKAYHAIAAKHGMRCHPWLGWALNEFKPENEKMTAQLKSIINTFKDSPGMGLWKGADEPQWGKRPVEPMINIAKIIHETDPNHPIWIVQAPRGTAEQLKAYDPTYDVTGIDIYPISYPPGVHVPAHPNKEISMVGDYTQLIREVAAVSNKPVWMTLQIAFSGTVKPTATLRMPTFPEIRYFSYQAIINGARGLVYFGGGLPQTHNARDKALGWNWTFWENTLRRLLADEIGNKSPLQPALVAPDSKLPIKVTLEKSPVKKLPAGDADPAISTSAPANTPAPGMEFITRQVGDDIYIIASKREGDTIQVRFSGLPEGYTQAEVMFESPRIVKAKDGSFTDWFAPFDVHVYKFKK